MAKPKTPAKGTGSASHEDDRYRVALIARSREALGALLEERGYDTGPMERRDDRHIEATLYLTTAQIARLREEDWELEVHENLSELGRQRQKEVGKGDRFEGGTVPPKGLGKKTQPKH